MGNLPAGDAPDEEAQGKQSPAAGEAAPPPGAAGERTLARVRSLMLISALTTVIAIAAVLVAVGYRMFRAGGEGGAAAPVKATIVLPTGARVIATAASDARIAVTIEVAGATEIRTFDARTLRETGRLRLVPEPWP